MKEKLLDKSNYFRGLLVLIRKTRKIRREEASMIMRVGKRLGFAIDFCKNAIRELLENPNISNEPPKFYNKNTAKEFLNDGIRLTVVDKHIDPSEVKWLKAVATKNNVDWNSYKSKLKIN